MIHLLTLCICILAFAALALAMTRHQEAIFRRELQAPIAHALRGAGWCGLALGLAIIVAGRGWALGLVAYSGHTSLAAGLVYVALVIRGRSST
ncbi:DUF3325 domain-containing protein [Bordetella flabilis]|uniref:DUF3325 domain-containing protein n=1 Tax=Bordetella flabilis TaxID=463014 RepID=A0A193GI62_9BORD|nr:DUF3325 domain-containing protein [Bordetella flabilis]ANN79520.1 hypothetical protein BAU07_22505 [Bordetella flabilis]